MMTTTRPSSVTRLSEVFVLSSCVHAHVFADCCFTPPLAPAGAAAFFAMREYEKHQEQNGQPPSHEFAKELMAGIAGAEVSPFAVLL